eukprot:404660-Prymnesium_polylepis.1
MRGSVRSCSSEERGHVASVATHPRAPEATQRRQGAQAGRTSRALRPCGLWDQPCSRSGVRLRGGGFSLNKRSGAQGGSDGGRLKGASALESSSNDRARCKLRVWGGAWRVGVRARAHLRRAPPCARTSRPVHTHPILCTHPGCVRARAHTPATRPHKSWTFRNGSSNARQTRWRSAE